MVPGFQLVSSHPPGLVRLGVIPKSGITPGSAEGWGQGRRHPRQVLSLSQEWRDLWLMDSPWLLALTFFVWGPHLVVLRNSSLQCSEDLVVRGSNLGRAHVKHMLRSLGTSLAGTLGLSLLSASTRTHACTHEHTHTCRVPLTKLRPFFTPRFHLVLGP